MTAGHAIVLADGEPPTRRGLDAAWPGWDDGVDLVVAADGGARLAASLGLSLDAWVGDGDSTPESDLLAMREMGVDVRRSPVAKDESDTELALLAAVERGAGRVTILGALGWRIDHALANLVLLAHPRAADVAVALLHDGSRVRLLRGGGRMELPGTVGDIVSLIPLGDAAGVTIEGLRYPLADEPLPAGPARGLSNIRERNDAAVRLRAGRLLVVEVPATLRR